MRCIDYSSGPVLDTTYYNQQTAVLNKFVRRLYANYLKMRPM